LSDRLALFVCRFFIVVSDAIEDGDAGLGESAPPFNLRFIYQEREACSFIPDTAPCLVAAGKVSTQGYTQEQAIIPDASTQSDQLSGSTLKLRAVGRMVGISGST
jgi:hypothetical protein